MKAYVTTGQGPTGIVLADVPEPEPRRDQAVVEVRAVAVNRGDLALAAARPAESRLGWDVAGTVLRPAADGSGPAAGTRVVALAEDRDGWAERVAVRTGLLAPLPDGVSDTAAAALPVAGLTALYALQRAGWLLGRTVLVTGAGGGVGRFLVRLAAAGGARVVAWVGEPERRADLRELGADAVAGYGDPEPAVADVVVDSVGGDVLRRAYERVAPGGAVVSYGNTVREELVLPIDWGHMHQGVSILHINLLDELTRRPQAGRDLALLVDLVARGTLDPNVGKVASWTDLEQALNDLLERRVTGKLVLEL